MLVALFQRWRRPGGRHGEADTASASPTDLTQEPASVRLGEAERQKANVEKQTGTGSREVLFPSPTHAACEQKEPQVTVGVRIQEKDCGNIYALKIKVQKMRAQCVTRWGHTGDIR